MGQQSEQPCQSIEWWASQTVWHTCPAKPGLIISKNQTTMVWQWDEGTWKKISQTPWKEVA